MCEQVSTYGLIWVGKPWRVCLGCTMAFVELLQSLFTATGTSRRDYPEMISWLWLAQSIGEVTGRVELLPHHVHKPAASESSKMGDTSHALIARVCKI